jgi:phage-related protein
MIISILGDSFDEFQLYAIYYDNKEMTQVILEIEEIAASLLKPKDLKMYLHICTNYYISDENTWQGKVVDLRAVVQDVENKINKNIEKKISEVENKIGGVENAIENKIAGVENAIENKIAGVENKIDGVESRFNEKINAVESKVAVVDSKIDILIDLLNNR